MPVSEISSYKMSEFLFSTGLRRRSKHTGFRDQVNVALEFIREMPLLEEEALPEGNKERELHCLRIERKFLEGGQDR